MQSPAGIKKSESCRRANASRINLGRTGLSGEVGVKQRLRRALRRSPDPEEIQHEMARNKGYDGQCKSQRKNTEIMHGNEIVTEVFGGGSMSVKQVVGQHTTLSLTMTMRKTCREEGPLSLSQGVPGRI